MNTIQEQLFAQLSGLAAGGVYPIVAEQNAVYPYLVYQRVASPVENTLDGNGNPPINNTRFQIDAWDLTYGGAVTLAAAVKAAMSSWGVPNVQLHEHDQYEADVKAFRIVMDFSVWHA